MFDRYLEYSTKSCTRQARGAGGCKTFQLTYSSPLPTQTQVLNNPKNKKQLIAIIVQKLKQSLTEQISQHKLVITGQEDCPIELSMGLCIERQDLINHHEEADVIVVSQAIYVSSVEKKSVGVVADDTDIFILLLYHFKLTQPSSAVMMIPTKHGQGRIIADIGMTAEDLGNLCLELLPAHALTGCDQVPMHYGIAKKKMLKAAKENQNSLSLLGKLEENFDDVMNQATRFIASCYSVQGVSNMTEARLKVWNRKAMKKTANKAPPLCSLPPTTAAFKENVKRAHLQAAVWISATSDPPNVDTTKYGWERQDESKMLLPSTLPPKEKVAPDEVMKVLCCTCSSERPCFTRACGCHAAPLGCTEHCNCEGGIDCNNPFTVKSVEKDSDDE